MVGTETLEAKGFLLAIFWMIYWGKFWLLSCWLVLLLLRLISWSKCLNRDKLVSIREGVNLPERIYLLLASLEAGMFEAVLVVRALGLVEVVHVQLSDERREIIVFEESRENGFWELVLLLHYEWLSIRWPWNNRIVLLILQMDTVKNLIIRRLSTYINYFIGL